MKKRVATLRTGGREHRWHCSKKINPGFLFTAVPTLLPPRDSDPHDDRSIAEFTCARFSQAKKIVIRKSYWTHGAFFPQKLLQSNFTRTANEEKLRRAGFLTSRCQPCANIGKKHRRSVRRLENNIDRITPSFFSDGHSRSIVIIARFANN